MKLAIATILITGVAAFAPSAPIVVARGVATTALFSEPEAEEGGLDLDLGEMFDMYVSQSVSWLVVMIVVSFDLLGRGVFSVDGM